MPHATASPPSRRPLRRRARSIRIWILASVLAACGEPTAVSLRFDLVDAWAGRFQGTVVGFPLRLRIDVQDGERLAGSAEVGERDYDLTGRYAAPTLYLRMTSAVDTLSFVGEVPVPTFISGTLVVDAEGEVDRARVQLARR